MGTNAKRKTTMAKLNRERKQREKRVEKRARKEARKLAASDETVVLDDALHPEVPAEGLPD
jgi:hypothetical protein